MLIAEFAPQSGTLLTWPHAHSDWQPSLAAVTPVYIELARAITRQQRLLIICFDTAHRAELTGLLARAGVDLAAVSFHPLPSNDTWIRDYGPLATRVDGGIDLHDFVFDGWDHRYPADLDDRITGSLHATGVFGDITCRRHSLVLEGGSIDTDGCGTLLTTTRCLLSSGRNPGYDRAAIEAALRATLGAERVLWLAHGEIIGDDTDGHIDMLARFCSADTIAYTRCTDKQDPHYPQLEAMQAELEHFSTADGRPYRLVPLPLPAACLDADNRRLPASYANFLIINDAVLMPAYQDPADAVARQALAACFPGREIIPVDCLPLIRQNGSLHCATLQLPAGVLTEN